MDKDLRRLIEAATEQGWRVVQTGSNHFKAYSPDGHTIANMGGTPSDHRAWENMLRDLRRGGFDVEAYKGRKKQKGGR